MTVLPSISGKTISVSSLCSRYNLTRKLFSQKWSSGSFAPIDWPRKGSRNSDSTKKQRNFSTCFLSGEQHTPATGVNKCSNPDEGTLNEVSSLANEKFISSRNKYGAKGKRILVGVLEARHCIQVCWAAHKMNELVAQNNKLTCRGVYSREIYIKQPPSQATT